MVNHRINTLHMSVTYGCTLVHTYIAQGRYICVVLYMCCCGSLLPSRAGLPVTPGNLGTYLIHVNYPEPFGLGLSYPEVFVTLR